MRTAWALVAVVVVVGCSSKKKDQPTPLVVEEEMPPPTQPVVPPLPDDSEPAAVPDDPPDVPPSNPECVDAGTTVVSWDPAKLRACFDSNGDDEPDRCVTWRRDGKVASIDTTFAVEDVDAKEPPSPPIEFRSDTENNDDERISLDGSSIEVCPYEHACMRIMPKSEDSEVTAVFTDADYKRGAFLMRDYEGGKATLEIWDLVAGRMKTRTPMKRLLEDEAYDFSMVMGSGALLVLAADSNGHALGSLFSLDGSFRGEAGQGSRNLDVDKTFQHAGVFGIVDVGPLDADEKPYVLYLQSLATGGAIGKFSIPRVGELSFDTLPNNFVAVTQWGEQLRIDMIDLRTRTNRVLLAPGC